MDEILSNCSSLNELFSIDFDWFEKCKLHEICSYIAMYPPELVHRLLAKYTNVGDSVYDPFSGRGTTLLEARLMGRQAYASDLNPLAYVLSKSKSFNPNLNRILKRIDYWESEFNSSQCFFNKNDFDYMKTYFSKKVYKQIYFIRERFGKRWKTLSNRDNFILACTLGILHGPSSKDGSSSFISISMSNTNSMSKNYVDKYVKLHNLKFPINENVFNKIRVKAARVLSDVQRVVSKTTAKGQMKIGNALNCKNLYKQHRFDLILTSPPYLNIFNYTRENWIRLWLLGFNRVTLSNNVLLDDGHRLEEYKKFLTSFMLSAHSLLNNNSKLIMIIGDVENKYKFLNLWDSIRKDIPFKLIEHCYDYRANNKSTRKNGSRAGRATKQDNICVFERIK